MFIGDLSDKGTRRLSLLVNYDVTLDEFSGLNYRPRVMLLDQSQQDGTKRYFLGDKISQSSIRKFVDAFENRTLVSMKKNQANVRQRSPYVTILNQ